MRPLRHTVPLLVAGIGSISGVGCTHNYYYSDPALAAACAPPAVVTATAPARRGKIIASSPPVVVGSYCDVPAGEPGVSSGLNARAPVTGGAAPSRVALGSPATAAAPAAAGRGWRNRKEFDSATTRITGTLDEEDLTR